MGSNLVWLGSTTVNIDRVAYVQDEAAPAAGASAAPRGLRLFWDGGELALSGIEADALRFWLKNSASHPLAAFSDEPAASPELQLRNTAAYLLGLIEDLARTHPLEESRALAKQLVNLIEFELTSQNDEADRDAEFLAAENDDRGW